MHQELSYLAIDKQILDFPAHFHETYCISLILSGIEQLNLNGQSHFAEAGSVTITHPYEVHSQPLISKDHEASFITIYISEDMMHFYGQGDKSTFIQRRIDCEKVRKSLLNLRGSMDAGIDNQNALRSFISSLNPFMDSKPFSEITQTSKWIGETKSFISHHINEKISLDELARISNLNKFGFSKEFKSQTGMSPINYVLMKKIFAAKDQINKESNLTSIAYDFDFTDMAHFSNTFKRFVGLSPKNYKATLTN